MRAFRTGSFVPILALVSVLGLSLVELPLRAADEILVAKVQSVEGGRIFKIEWKAPTSKIASLPEWTLKDGALPLSIDQAVKIASGEIEKQFPNITGWKLGGASLFKMTSEDGKDDPLFQKKYFYLIDFAPLSDADMQSIKQQKKESLLSQVILLDGTVLVGKETVGKLGE